MRNESTDIPYWFYIIVALVLMISPLIRIPYLIYKRIVGWAYRLDHLECPRCNEFVREDDFELESLTIMRCGECGGTVNLEADNLERRS